MEQQNNSALLNDAAGVLPMDTYVIVNGIHDEGENDVSSKNTGGKKGRGRPPKSAGSTKVINNSDTPKRARGRPPKTGETTPIIKKVVTPKEVAPINGDESKKRRGRPSKTSTPNEQTNGISKPHVQSTPVSNHQEQENVDEAIKKKRGRPSGLVPKKAVVVPTPSAPKESSSTKKRGRPSGTGGIKKSASKPKVSASNDDGSAKKRGRPKKPAGSPTPVATTPINETIAAVTPNNI